MAIRVEQVHPRATFVLRQSVLRPHETIEQMALLGDDDPATAAFAAIDDGGEVVGTVRLAPATPPASLAVLVGDRPSWQLRGMATRADLRRAGIGARVLAAAIDRVATHGGGFVWCNARATAIAFYRREGFVEHGAHFDDPHIGPHIVMWRLIDRSAGD